MRVCSCQMDSPFLLLLLIVVSTCACVEYFGRALESLIKKVTVHLIHGKMKHKRNKIFADFRALKRSEPAGLCTDCSCPALSLNHCPICTPAASWCAPT